MHAFSFTAPLVQLLNTIRPDDASLSLIALLIGMAGGWRLTEWHEQLKAKRAKVPRKPRALPRKPD